MDGEDRDGKEEIQVQKRLMKKGNIQKDKREGRKIVRKQVARYTSRTQRHHLL